MSPCIKVIISMVYFWKCNCWWEQYMDFQLYQLLSNWSPMCILWAMCQKVYFLTSSLVADIITLLKYYLSNRVQDVFSFAFSWWLMMLNIFSYFFGHLGSFFHKLPDHVLAHFSIVSFVFSQIYRNYYLYSWYYAFWPHGWQRSFRVWMVFLHYGVFCSVRIF